jgi:hypothetical protein
MLRFLARWFAKQNYLWQLEFESAKSDVNADLAKRNANEKRVLAAQLRREPDDIEANIKNVEAEEEKRKDTKEYKKLTLKEVYEDEHAARKERQDAESMVAEKRRIAEQHEKDVEGGEQTEKHLRGLADNGRSVADKIRGL